MVTTTKRAICSRIAHRLGRTTTSVQAIVQALMDEVVEELANGNRLEFRSFGVFEIVKRKPRPARPRSIDRTKGARQNAHGR